ncbi:protein TRC8 homolog [Lingula anatina]|uniref:Protein TRC8 homolog n=1 Tax=Lingula anatina TaxID=7574 RepID=A0A1S3H943_LINAN|nr:protein TRC8 homolog [Lingula anatina]|eukprot:XP_013381996.1 protein TRC8 homolog [Lingula anatina]
MARIMEVFLRIPPLFTLDVILNHSVLSVIVMYLLPADVHWYHVAFLFLAIVAVFIGAAMLFFMSKQHLLNTYTYIGSLAVIYSSLAWNRNYINTEITRDFGNEQLHHVILGNWRTLLGNIMLQIAAAYVWNRQRMIPRHVKREIAVLLPWYNRVIYFILISPTVARLVIFPRVILLWIPGVSAMILILEIAFLLTLHVRSIARVVYVSLKNAQNTIKDVGLQIFLENHWIRLQVPLVLRVFWLCMLLQELMTKLILLENRDSTSAFAIDSLNELVQDVTIRGCATIVAVLGMTSCVSYITHYIGIFMAYLIQSDNEEDRSMGTVSAILFFILALQTGLTSLSPEKKIQRLYRNFCLLGTAILHFIHSMVNPLMMSLSAQRNMAVHRHVRVLAMCAFLVIIPSCFLFYLWSVHSISTWMLAVTAFCVEVVIKVVITLMVYSLFMFDAYRDTFWEQLDDYVYYIKSAGSTIEFLFGIFLFCNGAWIMAFESGGTIRAIMMCIHAYFNIWVQAKEGWSTFMKRRTAVNKINSLPEATREQLENFNDVCAICYQELNNAKITRCNHYFHSLCLRKWLYVQEKCPLCHNVIYNTEQRTTGTQTEENRPDGQEGQDAVPQ